MAEDVDVGNLSYERALEELDALIARLEAGRVDLEEALSCYERGTKLACHCQELLDRTEAKVSKVVLGGGARLEERPLEDDAVRGSEAVSVAPRGGDALVRGRTPLRARPAPALFPATQPTERPDDDPPSVKRIDPDDIPF